jgi:hypothetical protein
VGAEMDALDSQAMGTCALELADYCQWWPLGGAPCYASAAFVLVRPSGETLGFSCAAHRDAWTGQVQNAHVVLDRAASEAKGRGYLGLMLGG